MTNSPVFDWRAAMQSLAQHGEFRSLLLEAR